MFHIYSGEEKYLIRNFAPQDDLVLASNMTVHEHEHEHDAV